MSRQVLRLKWEGCERCPMLSVTIPGPSYHLLEAAPTSWSQQTDNNFTWTSTFTLLMNWNLLKSICVLPFQEGYDMSDTNSVRWLLNLLPTGYPFTLLHKRECHSVSICKSPICYPTSIQQRPKCQPIYYRKYQYTNTDIYSRKFRTKSFNQINR